MWVRARLCAPENKAPPLWPLQVKSLAMDNLEQSDLKVLADIGNRRGNELPSRQRRICRMVPIDPSTSWSARPCGLFT